MSLSDLNIYSPKSKDMNVDRSAAVKRLQKELMELMVCGDKSISAFPDGENLFRLVFFYLSATILILILTQMDRNNRWTKRYCL